VKLGGTVATVGFPDIGLQNFLTTKHTNYTKMKDRFIPCPLSCVWCISWLKSFPMLLAKGEIASLADAADDPRYFQISLPVQPGNSGGALVDARGNVVGIVAAKLDASAALAATGSLPES
jgi:hypothetical protein